jgi:hypothetical protein
MLMRAVCLPLFAIAGAAALAAQLYAQSKPNFSGDWTMVPEKSTFGMMPTPTTMTRTITHKDPAVKIVTAQTGGSLGDTTVETNFTTDGKPQNNTVSGMPMSTVGAWDGAALTFHSTLNQQGTDITIDDRYELSDAGQTLTITRKFGSADGGFEAKIVFKKK